RQPGSGDDRQLEKKDEADRAERGDAAVMHDGKRVLGAAAGQTVEAIGEPIEVETSGQELPDRHGEQPGEERGEERRRHALGGDEHHTDAETDYRKPDRGATESVNAARDHAR